MYDIVFGKVINMSETLAPLQSVSSQNRSVRLDPHKFISQLGLIQKAES